MAIWPFRSSRVANEAQRLLDAVTHASRQPALYGEGRTPDTLEGRFELLTLHAALVLHRLKAAPDGDNLAQVFTDRLFRHVDSGLREAGVSDLAVPKRMRALAGAFYGRLAAYAGALDAGDQAALAAAVGRNVLGAENAPYAGALAAYVAAAHARQSQAPIDALGAPETWAAA